MNEMFMNEKISNILDKLNKKVNAEMMSVGSEFKPYQLMDTPFDTLTTLIGGIPYGRFTTVAGPEHTGKGAFLLQLIAYHQAKDPDFIALWTDAESSFEPTWAQQLGVDLDRIIIQRYAGEADIMETLLDAGLKVIKESQCISLWVIDSIGALVPKADLYDSKDADKGLEGMKMLNLQVKMGEFYRKANTIINRNPTSGYKGCAVVLIGQIYTVPDAQVSLQEVRGGNAVKHWAHLRLILRRGPKSEWPEPVDVVGIDGNTYKVRAGWSGRFKVEKTRINKNESKEIALSFVNGKGFDSFDATINAAFGLGIISRAGGTYTIDAFPDTKWRGRETLVQHFKTNAADFDKLKQAVNTAAITASENVTSVTKTEEINEV